MFWFQSNTNKILLQWQTVSPLILCEPYMLCILDCRQNFSVCVSWAKAQRKSTAKKVIWFWDQLKKCTYRLKRIIYTVEYYLVYIYDVHNIHTIVWWWLVYLKQHWVILFFQGKISPPKKKTQPKQLQTQHKQKVLVYSAHIGHEPTDGFYYTDNILVLWDFH